MSSSRSRSRKERDRRYWLDTKKNDPDARFRSSGAWQRIRLQHLATHSLCADCMLLGQLVPGTDVDHKIPPRGSLELQTSPSNLRTLCRSHHNDKTRADQRPSDDKPRLLGYTITGDQVFAPPRPAPVKSRDV
jgi:5-methylcytosine-specific restriction endonuclease McrA